MQNLLRPFPNSVKHRSGAERQSHALKLVSGIHDLTEISIEVSFLLQRTAEPF